MPGGTEAEAKERAKKRDETLATGDCECETETSRASSVERWYEVRHQIVRQPYSTYTDEAGKRIEGFERAGGHLEWQLLDCVALHYWLVFTSKCTGTAPGCAAKGRTWREDQGLDEGTTVCYAIDKGRITELAFIRKVGDKEDWVVVEGEITPFVKDWRDYRAAEFEKKIKAQQERDKVEKRKPRGSGGSHASRQ